MNETAVRTSLAPAFTIVTVLSFILIFRAFDLIYVLGGPAGVPDGATLVIGVLIYGDAFGQGSFSNQARFSFAMADADMEEGIRRIHEWVKA